MDVCENEKEKSDEPARNSNLMKFMWRRQFDSRPFENIVRAIREIYPVFCLVLLFK